VEGALGIVNLLCQPDTYTQEHKFIFI